MWVLRSRLTRVIPDYQIRPVCREEAKCVWSICRESWCIPIKILRVYIRARLNKNSNQRESLRHMQRGSSAIIGSMHIGSGI
jgi:hypothetical protein